LLTRAVCVAAAVTALAGCGGGDGGDGGSTATVDSNAAQKVLIDKLNAVCKDFDADYASAKGDARKTAVVIAFLREVEAIHPAGAVQTETFDQMRRHARLLREAMEREDDRAIRREQRRYGAHLEDMRTAGSTC
jgi:hypothetical protein